MQPITGAADGAVRDEVAAERAVSRIDRRGSKSATASNRPPVRMNALTACLRRFASGVPELPFAVSDEVIVAPTILNPFAFTRDTSSFMPAMIASAGRPS